MQLGQEEIRTIGDVERMVSHGARRYRRTAGWEGWLYLSTLVLVLGSVIPSSLPLGARVAGCVTAGVCLVVAVLLSRTSRRVRRPIVQKLLRLNVERLPSDAFEVGEEFRKHVVLAADADLLHVADQRSQGAISASRKLLVVVGIVCILAFCQALISWGGFPHHLIPRAHGKELVILFVTFWCSPLIGLAAVYAGLRAYPVQWIASRDASSVTFEQMVWMGHQRLREVPATDVIGFGMESGELSLKTKAGDFRLLELIQFEDLCSVKPGVPRHLYDALQRERACRAAANIARVLHLPPERARLM
jgi:hypothetical protein